MSFAPVASMRRALPSGTDSGVYTVAGTSSSAAAVATASPWLPPDAVTTRSGRADSNAFNAPRTLNEPVSWSCSSFSTTGRPSTVARSTGVCRA
jgi:hypothetical protein